MTKQEYIKLEAKKELARREFFFYCNLKAPDFYKPERTYLVDLCNGLQEFYEDEEAEILIINEPPRHGKSRTVGCFVEWVFGDDKELKVMTGSYNETLSTTFSKGVRNTIQEEKADADKVVYTDLFPDVKIKQGDGAMNLWSLEGGYNNYLATSPSGTATGFGANLMIIDDLIKRAEEAYNVNVLDKHWDWFTNTMLSRLEEGGKIIIIMTRWHTDDLAGRVLNWCKKEKKNYKHINMMAILDEDKQEMLCPEILSYKSAKSKEKVMGHDIFSANYQQKPINLEGQLYKQFKTYTELPPITKIKAYCDTADAGSDYLCNIIYGIYQKEAYILDVYFTKDGMEITEKETARRLHEHKVNWADIESNNGGRGFARSVERILDSTFNSNLTNVNWFHQSKNKTARILSNSAWIMEHVYYPVNWMDKWPEFFNSMTTYQKEGKNAHDDAQDAITGVAEKINSDNRFGF